MWNKLCSAWENPDESSDEIDRLNAALLNGRGGSLDVRVLRLVVVFSSLDEPPDELRRHLLDLVELLPPDRRDLTRRYI